jgi:hypothetical protein
MSFIIKVFGDSLSQWLRIQGTRDKIELLLLNNFEDYYGNFR